MACSSEKMGAFALVGGGVSFPGCSATRSESPSFASAEAISDPRDLLSQLLVVQKNGRRRRVDAGAKPRTPRRPPLDAPPQEPLDRREPQQPPPPARLGPPRARDVRPPAHLEGLVEAAAREAPERAVGPFQEAVEAHAVEGRGPRAQRVGPPRAAPGDRPGCCYAGRASSAGDAPTDEGARAERRGAGRARPRRR